MQLGESRGAAGVKLHLAQGALPASNAGFNRRVGRTSSSIRSSCSSYYRAMCSSPVQSGGSNCKSSMRCDSGCSSRGSIGGIQRATAVARAAAESGTI